MPKLVRFRKGGKDMKVWGRKRMVTGRRQS